MDLEQQQRPWWSSFVLLMVLCLIATACRVDAGDLSTQQAAGGLPQATALPEPLDPPVTPDEAVVSESSSSAPTIATRSPAEPQATSTPIPTPPPTPTPTPTPTPVPIVDAWNRMGALNVRLNFWIYHLGADVDGSNSRDLFRTHAWRKESERLTNHGGVTSSIELSPNGRWLAYVVESGAQARSLHIMDVTSRSTAEMGPVEGFGYISWSPDSREVLVNHTPGDAPNSGAIHAINIDDGSRRTLVESTTFIPSNAVLVDENDLVLWEISNRSWRLVRMRLDTGERQAEFETSYLGYRAYDRDNQVLYLTQHEDDTGHVIAIDLAQPGLEVAEIPNPPEEESHVAISPSGTRVAYVNGAYGEPNELYFVDLRDPTAVLHLTLDLGGRSMARGVKWAPASTAVVFGYGPFDREELVVVAQDGTMMPLGVPGVPYAIVHDGT